MQTFWIMCSKGICGWVSIYTLNPDLDWYCINIPFQLIIRQHFLSWWLAKCHQLAWADQNLADCGPTVNWKVKWVSIKCQLRCWWSVDGYQSGVDQAYLWKVLIGTQPQMPLVNMLWLFPNYCQGKFAFLYILWLYHFPCFLEFGFRSSRNFNSNCRKRNTRIEFWQEREKSMFKCAIFGGIGNKSKAQLNASMDEGYWDDQWSQNNNYYGA